MEKQRRIVELLVQDQLPRMSPSERVDFCTKSDEQTVGAVGDSFEFQNGRSLCSSSFRRQSAASSCGLVVRSKLWFGRFVCHDGVWNQLLNAKKKIDEAEDPVDM